MDRKQRMERITGLFKQAEPVHVEREDRAAGARLVRRFLPLPAAHPTGLTRYYKADAAALEAQELERRRHTAARRRMVAEVLAKSRLAGLSPVLGELLQERFGTPLLKDLADADLRHVHQVVASAEVPFTAS